MTDAQFFLMIGLLVTIQAKLEDGWMSRVLGCVAIFSFVMSTASILYAWRVG